MMKRLILASVLIAAVALAVRPKPEPPPPVEDPAAAAAARRAEGDAAIRARRTELRAQREKREGKGDDVMRSVYEGCRRNSTAEHRHECEGILHPKVHTPTKEQPLPEGSGAIDIRKLYSSKP
jgi:hypothetical protein